MTMAMAATIRILRTSWMLRLRTSMWLPNSQGHEEGDADAGAEAIEGGEDAEADVHDAGE